MSYIIKKNSPLVNLKLTDTGRRNLANGSLTFSKFGLGDSEVDYLTHDSSDTFILRPVDNQPNIMFPVASEGSNYLVNITNLNSIPKEIRQSATERGMYTYTGTTRILDTQLTKDGLYSVTSVTGDTCVFTRNTGLVGTAFAAGDTVLIKTGYGSASTDLKFDKAEAVLQYKILEKVSSNTTSVTVRLDRSLPAFISTGTTAYVYSNKLVESLDNPDPSTYWDDSVLSFEQNGVTTYDDVPVWNFNLVLMGDMIGVDPIIDKNKGQTLGKKYLGTSVLFKHYESAKLDKVGVIHYTNNSVSNWYGEGFYRDTFKLHIPHVLWHKKQSGGPSKSTGIGYTFVCGKEQKVLESKVRYYELIDQETIPTVVGKVFPDYKLAVIEDPELLMAMSIKGNRNWTLPQGKLSATEPGTCTGASTAGALAPGEVLHVTYLMQDTKGVTPVHCNKIVSFEIPAESTGGNKDVLFEFPKNADAPFYSEFGYLRNYTATGDTTGFKVNKIHMLWQKTHAGEQPSSEDWKIADITNYLGTTGCLVQNGGDIAMKTQRYKVGTNLTTTSIKAELKPENDIVYVYYNGVNIDPSGYTYDSTTMMVNLTALPISGTEVKVAYVIDNGAYAVTDAQLTADNIQNLRVFIDKNFLDNSEFNTYNLRDFVPIPAITSTEPTFGDEDFLLGNVQTDIKATIFKSVMSCVVLPNKFVTSTNPTFNVNQDKTQFSEIGIYDVDNDLVAIGKFSQPLKRKYNSDILVIQAAIDF